MIDPKLTTQIPVLNKNFSLLGLDVEVLNHDPPVVYLKNLLTPWECRYLIELSKPKLESSTMIIGNQELVNKQSRSSRSAFITKNGQLPNDNPVIHRFLNRLSQLCGRSVNHFEGMKVVNYQPGEQYLAHHDYFREHTNFIKESGDRQMTFFVYLNDLDEDQGGATCFPELDLKVKPRAGDGVFWVNIDFEGNYFDKTLHAGEVVKSEKWGVNIWVRERSY